MPNGWGIPEHLRTTRVVKQLAQVDQTDANNLLAVGTSVRKLQATELSYNENVEDLESRGGKQPRRVETRAKGRKSKGQEVHP